MGLNLGVRVRVGMRLKLGLSLRIGVSLRRLLRRSSGAGSTGYAWSWGRVLMNAGSELCCKT